MLHKLNSEAFQGSQAPLKSEQWSQNQVPHKCMAINNKALHTIMHMFN